ncbi:hypothetical protein QBC47DRAFT_413572 [Echria macrotheca]|uniref:Uncharacterized protein n=1 Tax=Echria macrotheca TaxID=438768 RepID=A0AAJ0BCN7_9PEZI|nr:hypothetical protein QBC47DRAFT_413572 [Echria macrotheca]
MASSTGPSQPAVGATAAAASDEHSECLPHKRPPDDEILFVSANPVKKQRALPAMTAMQPAPVPDMMGSDGISFPTLDTFTFSQPPRPNRPQRVSQPLSPKQLPQTISPPLLSPALIQPGIPSQPARPTGSTVRLDQISCLDFSTRTTTPGLDLGQLFPATTNEVPAGTEASVPVSAPPPLGPIGTQNAIPFTMYSTGNIVPMPAQPYSSHPAASPVPHQHAASLSSGRTNAGGPGQQVGSHERPLIWSPNTSYISSKPPSYATGRYAQPPGPHLTSSFLHHPHSNNNHYRPTLTRPIWPYHVPPRPMVQTIIPQQPQQQFTTSIPHPPPPIITSSTTASSYSHNHNHNHSPNHTIQQAPPKSPQKTTARDLLVDIAETIDARFPCAEVAARHGITTARVAEALWGVVLVPTLRCAAADNSPRRTRKDGVIEEGGAAEERIREFRDVKARWQAGTGTGRKSAIDARGMVEFLEGEEGRMGGGGV